VAAKARHARPYRGTLPVICIGNLTAGGSGKTPIAIAIAENLKARGHRPAFLTRGYGGKERGPVLVRPTSSAARMGDEALLLARTAPAIVARDRVMGAALAAGMNDVDVLVMDDGHQNFALAKTLSLVVVDGPSGFGNGLMLPAGPLREPVRQGLARADGVIVMGDGDPDLEGFAGPVLRARLVTQQNALKGQKVFAFAGIGRPEKFLASLEGAGAIITGHRFFADHHPYHAEDIAAVRHAAGDAQPVTTEKDWVRLDPAWRDGIAVLKVAARFDDPNALAGLLDSAGGAV
jgi:tetraacyldisaccharide 4'-kinase